MVSELEEDPKECQCEIKCLVPVCGLALYLKKKKKEINLKIICHHKNETKIKYLLPGKATCVSVFYKTDVEKRLGFMFYFTKGSHTSFFGECFPRGQFLHFV